MTFALAAVSTRTQQPQWALCPLNFLGNGNNLSIPGGVVKWWGFKMNTSSFDEVQN